MVYVPQTPLVESWHTGGFVVSMASGHRSIDRATLAAGQSLPCGSIVGLIAATGLVTALSPAATDGSENAFGILYADVNATTGNTACAVVVRDCEVNGAELVYGALTQAQITAAGQQLAAAHVIVR